MMKELFLAWGIVNENSWFGYFNFLVFPPLFVLGLFGKVWSSTVYRVVLLAVLFIFLGFTAVGFYYVAQPPA
ncbi:hypothetical protein [Chromobacterium violaceum]|uniref:hypothetical protein n=1 Tax=Chromobacterium violaceum TaxID=536 RepID=UPI0005BC2CB6|nr:hypothetical protein [Chromobacterium violaceum]